MLEVKIIFMWEVIQNEVEEDGRDVWETCLQEATFIGVLLTERLSLMNYSASHHVIHTLSKNMVVFIY